MCWDSLLLLLLPSLNSRRLNLFQEIQRESKEARHQEFLMPLVYIEFFVAFTAEVHMQVTRTNYGVHNVHVLHGP